VRRGARATRFGAIDLRAARDEHGYSGGITIVKDYVLARRLRHREVFVPLRHDPGHAQADFGEALAAPVHPYANFRFLECHKPTGAALVVAAVDSADRWVHNFFEAGECGAASPSIV
jgi:hypothetical protein